MLEFRNRFKQRRRSDATWRTSIESETHENSGTRGEKIRILMRSYDGSIPGPTIRVRKGDRLEIELANELARKPEGNEIWNELAYPNRTILHVHGMHVSPRGHGDNMFVSVNPGTSRRYVYDIPPQHPSGLFWGHAHSHGSSMLQTGYGLAFPIVVLDDDAVPQMLRNAPDRVLVVRGVRTISHTHESTPTLENRYRLSSSGPDRAEI